ncbi:unnamed protein product [Linum trigynum]|uniref:Reverse transcriptase zinc-binding domain-containing protein n=1 Tax=Linum trigynum TaxID=586398 RepID=A0AAV2FNW0_9ROSI
MDLAGSPKLRNFAWRFASGFLPIFTVLLCKKLITSMTCHVCSVGEENLQNCFSECRIAIGVWRLARKEPFRLQLAAFDHTNAWKS